MVISWRHTPKVQYLHPFILGFKKMTNISINQHLFPDPYTSIGHKSKAQCVLSAHMWVLQIFPYIMKILQKIV
jgi:hypothetical protein